MSETPGLDPRTIVSRWGERVYVLARRLTGNDADARDVAQNALLKAVENASTYRGDGEPMGWLYRITVNEARTLFRRRKRRPAVSLDALPVEFDDNGHIAQTVYDYTQNPDRGALSAEAETRVREAIEELPDGYREAVVLVDLHGLTYKDAAEILELTTSALKTRLHRARLHLRNRLESFWTAALGRTSGGDPS